MTESVNLIGNQRLVLDRGPFEDLLQVLDSHGAVSLCIHFTPTGAILRLEGTLAVEADRLDLRGREGVVIRSGGDLTLQADGDLTSAASIQNLTAVRGNVNVRANDDVKLNGECIRLNC
jgi:hypothetical protein